MAVGESLGGGVGLDEAGDGLAELVVGVAQATSPCLLAVRENRERCTHVLVAPANLAFALVKPPHYVGGRRLSAGLDSDAATNCDPNQIAGSVESDRGGRLSAPFPQFSVSHGASS